VGPLAQGWVGQFRTISPQFRTISPQFRTISPQFVLQAVVGAGGRGGIGHGGAGEGCVKTEEDHDTVPSLVHI